MNDNSPNNFLLLLELMAKRSRFIMSFVTIVTVVAVIVSLVLPKWYESTATLLPPKEITVPVGGLSKFAEAISVTGGLNLPVMVTQSDIYARMLKSLTIAESIIVKFDLMNRYETDNIDKTYEVLMDRANFRVTAEGLVTVSVTDKDPQTAADMANAFVAELDLVIRDIATQRARYNRDFIEQRLEQVKLELDSARATFEEFQVKNRAVDFEQQTRLVTSQAIQLKVKQAEVDLEIEMVGQELGQDNPKLIELQRKRLFILEQLDILEKENPDSSFFSVPMSEIPTLRGKYDLLYSQVRVSESLYEILLEQREQAKIQLSENSPTISVLDPARTPSIRSRPQRSLIVGAAFGFSLFIAILGSGIAEYLGRLKANSPEQYRIVEMFISAFFGWLPGVRKKKASDVGGG